MAATGGFAPSKFKASDLSSLSKNTRAARNRKKAEEDKNRKPSFSNIQGAAQGGRGGNTGLSAAAKRRLASKRDNSGLKSITKKYKSHGGLDDVYKSDKNRGVSVGKQRENAFFSSQADVIKKRFGGDKMKALAAMRREANRQKVSQRSATSK